MNKIETYYKVTRDGEIYAVGHFNQEEKLELAKQGYRIEKKSKNSYGQPYNKNGILVSR